MTTSFLSGEEILSSYKERFPTGLLDIRLEKHSIGIKKTELQHIWIHINKDLFKDAVRHLFTLNPEPHFAVTSGYDIGDTIELVYHFSVQHGSRHQEVSINITVSLPKTDPSLDTITDLFPGSLISEQEKQEMLGVKIIDIPVDSRVFISDDFPKGVYPWRKDETGPSKQIRNLHEVNK